jgi:WD40 repeat protein
MPSLLLYRIVVVMGIAIAAVLGTAKAQQTKEVVRRQRPQLLALGFSRDGSMLVSGGDSVRVHALDSGEMLQEARTPETTRVVAFSPSKKDVFVSAGDDRIVRFWRLKEDRPVRTLKEHEGIVLGLAFSPDGKLLATAAKDIENRKWPSGEFRLWDTESGELLRAENFREAGVSCAAFSTDGKLVAFSKCSNDREVSSSIEVFDVGTWKRVRSVSFAPGFANSIAFLPDEGLVIAGGDCVPAGAGVCFPTGRLWLASAGEKQARESDEVARHGYFGGAALLAGGRHVVTGTDTPVPVANEGRLTLRADLQVRESRTGKLVWSQIQEGDEMYNMYGACVSPSGKLIGCCSASTIFVFDNKGALVRTIAVGD